MFDFYGYKQLETLSAMEFADSYFVTLEKEQSWALDMDSMLYNSGASSCYCTRILKDLDGDASKLKDINQSFWINKKDGTSEKISEPMCYTFYKSYISYFSLFSLYCTGFSYFVVINATWIRMLLIYVG